MLNKPIVFVDLDDTLFQTVRKHLPTAQDRVATLDRDGNALSYMQPKQQHFLQWLHATTELIPVTARSVEALQRVQIDFQHGAICAHGGVILDAKGQLNHYWHQKQYTYLNALHAVMQELLQQLSIQSAALGEIRSWIVQEQNLGMYVVAKQQNPDILFLNALAGSLPAWVEQHFYLHQNGNNLAFIPHQISKQHAVQYWLDQHPQYADRAVLGFGDSLSDFGFMQCCDWFGMPKQSQMKNFLQQQLQQGIMEDA